MQMVVVLRSYVLGLSYCRYSLSTGSETLPPFLASGFSFTSGYISTSQASPPTVSQASAGKTLQKTDTEEQMKGIESDILYGSNDKLNDLAYEEMEL